MQGLRDFHESGRLSPAPLLAHAVTDAYHDMFEGIDDEELEYGALMYAAEESLRMIATTGGVPRRIVVSADVDGGYVYDRVDYPTGVQITEEITLRECSSVHVDDGDAEADVAGAIKALVASTADNDSDLGPVDDLSGRELLWFATQEISDILI